MTRGAMVSGVGDASGSGEGAPFGAVLATVGAGLAATAKVAVQGPGDVDPLGVADARIAAAGVPATDAEGGPAMTASAMTAPMTPPVPLRAFMRAYPDSPDVALAVAAFLPFFLDTSRDWPTPIMCRR